MEKKMGTTIMPSIGTPISIHSFSPSEPEAREERCANDWVAVKELNSSYYFGETLLFTIYTHYGNLI